MNVERFVKHAEKCGIDMRGRTCIDCEHPPAIRGAWTATDTCDPETLAVLYPLGYWITPADCHKLFNEYGIDYVVVSEH